MNNQNLIIHKFTVLYQILKEIEEDLNFNIINSKTDDFIKNEALNLKNYLIISKKITPNINNQISLSFLPIKILKLIEMVNIEFMKNQFSDQSKVNIKNYVLNLNSRIISTKENMLKLTEKEVNTIIYLSKKGKSINIDELEKNVWKYQSDIETHTVETHIYRLRKKFQKTFKDENFIISKKNGYQIK